MDTSDEKNNGLEYDDVLIMPEFIGNVFAPLVIAANIDSKTQKVFARQFVKICSILSVQLKPTEKKKCKNSAIKKLLL